MPNEESHDASHDSDDDEAPNPQVSCDQGIQSHDTTDIGEKQENTMP